MNYNSLFFFFPDITYCFINRKPQGQSVVLKNSSVILHYDCDSLILNILVITYILLLFTVLVPGKTEATLLGVVSMIDGGVFHNKAATDRLLYCHQLLI